MPALTFAHDAELEKLREELRNELIALLQLKIKLAQVERLGLETNSAVVLQTPMTITTPEASSMIEESTSQDTTQNIQQSQPQFISTDLASIFSNTPTRTTIENVNVPSVGSARIISASYDDNKILISSTINTQFPTSRVSVVAARGLTQEFLGTISASQPSATFTLQQPLQTPFTVMIRDGGRVLDTVTVAD